MPCDLLTKQYPETETFSFSERLDAIKRIKSYHTDLKRKLFGSVDNDDNGQIPVEEDFLFIPESDHPTGLACGAGSCGKNFRRFLQAMPTYINKHSSLLGGFYKRFPQHVVRWDPENHWLHINDEIIKYNIIDGIQNSHHFCGDINIGLKLGWKGLLDKIQQYRERNSTGDVDFYDGLEEVVCGIQDWMKKHIEAAKRQAQTETNEQIRNNLIQMAETNENILNDAPKTFHEAVQWIAWFQIADRAYNGSGGLGRLDQFLYPFYKKDREAGRISKEEALFDLACLNVSEPHYIHIGGIDAQGRDVTNEVSFLIIEAAHLLKIPANIAVGVHDGMNGELMNRCIELLFVDKLGTPRFFGSESKANGFARNGIPLELARERAQTGCHWFNLPGREYSFSDVIKINFAKVLDVALHEMMQNPSQPPSVEVLWDGFIKHLQRAVDVTALGIDFHMEHKHKYFPELLMDLFCYGPIEKGYDASHGSLEYNTICVDGSALATVADSFAAMEIRIEKEKKLSWIGLLYYLDQNYMGAEKVRLMMKNVPGYGRGGTRGDFWAEKVSMAFTELVKEKKTPDGWDMIPGIFSWASTMQMGDVTPATPNGRKKGEPISFGANPDNGLFKGGGVTPVSMSNAIARVQPGYGNTAPMQLDVDPGLVNSKEGVKQFDALMRAHFKMGGTLINANILDKKQIKDAYHHPEKYPDLVVRVTGFSAYFASLSPEFRKLVYDRIVEMER